MFVFSALSLGFATAPDSGPAPPASCTSLLAGWGLMESGLLTNPQNIRDVLPLILNATAAPGVLAPINALRLQTDPYDVAPLFRQSGGCADAVAHFNELCHAFAADPSGGFAFDADAATLARMRQEAIDLFVVYEAFGAAAAADASYLALLRTALLAQEVLPLEEGSFGKVKEPLVEAGNAALQKLRELGEASAASPDIESYARNVVKVCRQPRLRIRGVPGSSHARARPRGRSTLRRPYALHGSNRPGCPKPFEPTVRAGSLPESALDHAGAAPQLFFDLMIDNSGAGLDNPANGRAGLHLIPGVEASEIYGTAQHETRTTMSEEWNVLYQAWNARFVFGDLAKEPCAVASPLERTAWHEPPRPRN